MAKIRGVETCYLHVDVSNDAALGLYERAGYAIVSAHDTVYNEFTASLNLHDGATRGRNHYLLHKHILEPTWLPGEDSQNDFERGTLGFEMAA
jgi:RimJ/RimL family protein N-acetyltransferase